MTKTIIETIPYARQRYPSLGDYLSFADGDVAIFVTALPDWRFEFLIGLHEYIEEALTRHRGIPEPVIKAFDEAHLESDDPGMLKDAPYHREHVTATAIEMLLAQELGVDWDEYEKACAEAAADAYKDEGVAKVLKAADAPVIDEPMSAADMMKTIRQSP